MSQPHDPVKFAQALNELGVAPAGIHAIRTAASREQAQSLLDALKNEARSRYRKLARELHPDLTHDDPEKAAKFSFLSIIYQQIRALELPRPMPPLPVRPVGFQFQAFRVTFVPGVRGTTANPRATSAPTGTSTTDRRSRATFVVNMKPT